MQARRYQQDVAALDQVFEYIMQSLANYRWTRPPLDVLAAYRPFDCSIDRLGAHAYCVHMSGLARVTALMSGLMVLQDDVPADAGARQGRHPGAHDEWAQPLGQGESLETQLGCGCAAPRQLWCQSWCAWPHLDAEAYFALHQDLSGSGGLVSDMDAFSQKLATIVAADYTHAALVSCISQPRSEDA